MSPSLSGAIRRMSRGLPQRVRSWRRTLSRFLRPASNLETRLGYHFRQPRLLGHSLRHRSHAFYFKDGRGASNERLEFLGDSVLGLVTGRYLFLRYPALGEGALTQLRAALVRRDSLAMAARAIGLGESIKLSRAEERRGGRERESILADAFEAVIGAVFLDGGLDAATEVLERLLLMRADALQQSGDYINPKNLLQELVQEAGVRSPPDYRVISTEGPPHHRTFTVEVLVADRSLGRGKAQSKRAAEVEAARDAMRQISPTSRIIEEIARASSGRPDNPSDSREETPNLDGPSTMGPAGPTDGAERKQ